MNHFHPYKLRFTLRIDKNPCRRYRWRKRCTSYSGAHVCENGAGHKGWCRCGVCDAYGTAKDQAEPLPEGLTQQDLDEFLAREQERLR